MRLLGAVFAGGRGDRMGQDKAVLPWPDESGGSVALYVRAGRALAGLCERVEVGVGRAGRLPDAPWPTFVDVEDGAGPLAGLVAALERAERDGLDGVLALACDMPLVTEGELRPLLEAVERGADAALWVVDGHDQPLCSVYRTTCAAPARRAFDGGARRPVAIFAEPAADGRLLRLERIHASENSALRLVNVNTTTDYDRALRDASRRGAEGGRAVAGPDLARDGSTHRGPHER
ncbi:MAG: molybdenum cofactor guanylyltransferase [Planctomycetota bacterium]